MIRQTLQLSCALIAIVFSLAASATSIQKLDFETLAGMSEYIFEGEVLSAEARWNASKSRIHTYVTFRIDDVVKGPQGRQQLELRFAGGTIDDQHLTYQGMVYPKAGERGIYFVETLSRNLVNPLVGWSQGHYKIKGSQMMTNQNKPVMGIQKSLKAKTGELSVGVAGGMLLGSGNDDGMSKTEFKDQIKAALNK